MKPWMLPALALVVVGVAFMLSRTASASESDGYPPPRSVGYANDIVTPPVQSQAGAALQSSYTSARSQDDGARIANGRASPTVANIAALQPMARLPGTRTSSANPVKGRMDGVAS